MTSRMNDCEPLGKTGYPFVFAMNDDAGMKMCLIGSATQRFKTPGTDGRGGVRSRARQRSMVRHNPGRRPHQSKHLRLSADCKHRWTLWHPTSPMWHSAQPLMLSLTALSWIPVSESVSMARKAIRTERALFCHTECQRRSAEGRLPGRWRDHRLGVGWRIAYKGFVQDRC